MPDRPDQAPATPPPSPPPLTHFTLDSAYAHALLAPRAPSVFARQLDPFPDTPTVRCINPHVLAPSRGARP